MRILLRHHVSLHISRDPQLILDILTQAATLILCSEHRQPGFSGAAWSATISEPVSQRLGASIAIVLAVVESAKCAANVIPAICKLYPVMARTAVLAVRAVSDLLTVQDVEGKGAEMLSALLAMIRLALLLVQPGHSDKEVIDAALDNFWMRISPEWYRLVYLSLDPTCINLVSANQIEVDAEREREKEGTGVREQRRRASATC